MMHHRILFLLFLITALLVEITGANEGEGSVAPPCDCKAECAALVQESSATCKQQVQQTNAQLEATNAQLRQNEREFSSLQQAKAQLETKNAQLLQNQKELEQKLAQLSNQLKEETTQRAVHADSAQETIQRLEAQLKEALEHHDTLDTHANECKSNLVQVEEREKQLKLETEQHLTKARAEIDELTPYKTSAAQMTQTVEALRQDVDKHQRKASETRTALTRELEEERLKHKETLSSHSQSKQELHHAQKRMRELHSMVETTYVNVTLIQQDLAIGARKAGVWMGEQLESARVFLAPYYEQAVDALEPAWQAVVDQYKEHVEPHRVAAVATLQSEYETHVQPHVQKHILPHWRPVQAKLSQFHTMVCNALAQASQSLLHYLELAWDSPGDSMLYTFLWRTLHFGATQPAKALANVFYAILAILTLRWLWPRNNKRRANSVRKLPRAKVKFVTTLQQNRKGLRARRGFSSNGGSSNGAQ